jgi:nucleoside 2-deoxyribosyltransferase
MKPSVFIAGRMDESEWREAVKDLLRDSDLFWVFDPSDIHESHKEVSMMVRGTCRKRKDYFDELIHGLESCDFVIAYIDGCYGTSIEVGYAYGLDIPIYAIIPAKQFQLHTMSNIYSYIGTNVADVVDALVRDQLNQQSLCK